MSSPRLTYKIFNDIVKDCYDNYARQDRGHDYSEYPKFLGYENGCFEGDK